MSDPTKFDPWTFAGHDDLPAGLRVWKDSRGRWHASWDGGWAEGAYADQVLDAAAADAARLTRWVGP